MSAVFAINKYTLTYTAGEHGTLDGIASQTVNFGANGTAVTAVPEEGYHFVKWSDEVTDATRTETNVKANKSVSAVFAINTYTVSFNVYGGTAIANQTVAYNGNAVKPMVDPVKTGHTFGGWYTDGSFNTPYLFTDAVTGNTTINAKWTINNYTVSFNVYGGSPISVQTVVYNENAVRPAVDPTKTGYTFVGWYTDGTLNTPYSFASSITDNTTIYAKWSINNYAVRFQSNGGSSVANQSVTYNTYASEPAAPEKPGYDFRGWYTDSGMTSPFGFSTTAITSDLTLFAKWTMNSPGVPAIQSIVSGDSNAVITWTNTANATGYQVFQSTQADSYDNPVTTVSSSVYQYRATGLTNGTKYYFVVKAMNPDGVSPASNEVSAVPQVPSPGVPLLQTAIAGNAQVSLSWSRVAGSTGYKVYQSVTSSTYGTEVATVSGSVYTYNVAGLTNGTTYYFVVKATNPGGDSAASNEVSATPMTVPAAPTEVTAAAGNGQATITFKAPAVNGGSAITRYEVTASPGGIQVTGTGSPIIVAGLSNGISYTFTVKAFNGVGGSTPSDASNAAIPNSSRDSGSGSSSTTPVQQEQTNTGVNVLVNGKAENAGIATTTEINNQTVTTVAIDQKKLEAKLQAEGQGAVVTIPVNVKSDVVIGELNGQMVKSMEEKQAVVVIKTDQATYTLPAQQININAISEQVGKSVALQDIKIQIEIAVPTADMVQVVKNAAEQGTFTLVAPPVHFTVKGTYGNTTIEVSKFNAYVERTIAIPDDVDPNKITTGVVVEPDGTVRHVPTKIVLIDGKYFAKINSLTNSIYSIVWHPLQFSDAEGHWAKEAVNNMGSRMVINGTGGSMFSPDRDITRAEFAAIIVRGLGLKLESGAAPFSDVKASDWYSSAVHTAYAYGLIGGFEDGSFRPNDKITREQAMVIIAKAASLTGLKDKIAVQTTSAALAPYTDAADVSGWAQSGVADSVQAGIVSGRNGAQLAPKMFITRAEVAAIVQRLLQKSELI
ncbi:InlB B-repeat-containing protein [Paenibacillus sp. NPDC056579]|uniref:InlB B-repeat-containing protein n=1 Tax=Paenibacillus sp. NPDC056579 TaxID=3345871 RepID=UPI0036A443F5